MIAIAADTLTTWGSTKEPAEYIVNCEKLFKYMFTIYDDAYKTAEDIAKIGVLAGIEFDHGSGAPFQCYTVKLKK